ncbi:MAG: hypothetical protein HYY04_02610 [Chloroflexi bacterium]|nr:hypothetical protein [Chloroflexota bacterium]
MPTVHRHDLALLACALGVAVYPAGLLLGLAPTLPRHVALFFAAFVPYLIAVGLALRGEGRGERWEERGATGRGALGPPPSSLLAPRPVAPSGVTWVGVGVVALALRLATLATHPSLSDDLYRYVWDGKVALHGINPYAFPPSAAELAHLRGPLWRPINAKDLTTPYPPAAQALFAATYVVAGESVKAQQVVATLGDTLVIVALGVLLRQLGLPLTRLLIYAWNPLTLMHFAHGAHNDGWLVAPLLLAVAAARARRPASAAAALALGVLVKLFAGVALPALAATWRLRHLALFAVVIGLGFAPFFAWTALPAHLPPALPAVAAQGEGEAGSRGAAASLPAGVEAGAWLLRGMNPLRGVLVEASEARFNDSLYYVVDRLVGLTLGRNHGVTGPVVGIGLLGAMAVAWWRARRGTPAVDGAFTLVGLFLLLSPVVEPWYALWLLPFVALRLQPGRPWGWTPAAGWLLFSGLVVLTELTYVDFSARTWLLVRATEYGPLYGILAWSAAVWLRKPRTPSEPVSSAA